LAVAANSEDEAMSHYRRVRDEIRSFIEGLPQTLMDEQGKRGKDNIHGTND